MSPRLLLVAFVLIAIGSPAWAGEASDPAAADALKVGDKAPKFEALTDEGKLWKSDDHVGKKILVVYFYPADMTGGCTAQACAYRDALDKIKSAGVEVVGISGDSVENHQEFKKEYDLNFTLLADMDGAVSGAFGVESSQGGRVPVTFKDGRKAILERGQTTGRWTFIVGEDGKIVDKQENVDAPKDAARVLKKIDELKKPGA